MVGSVETRDYSRHEEVVETRRRAGLRPARRRRLKVKLEAEALFANVGKALREKTDALFALLDRRAAVVGVTSQDAARRYAGETLRLSQPAIQDVDQLFIMSACVDRGLADAEALLRPKSAGVRLANRFSRRYRRVLRPLRDEPIAFRPGEGLEPIVRGGRSFGGSSWGGSGSGARISSFGSGSGARTSGW
jgi:hypothetical protein